MPTDLSTILAAELIVRHLKINTPASAYITEFYETTNPYRASVYDARVTALAHLYAGVIFAIVYAHTSEPVQDVKDLIATFAKIKTFIVKTSLHNDDINRYVRIIGDTFYIMATRSSDKVTINQRALKYRDTLAVINRRFVSNPYKVAL